jgi:hypothetical protein
MFATSDDLFVNPQAQLQCKTHRDMLDKLDSLYPGNVSNIDNGLILLLDEIRARFRLEPVGIKGPATGPNIIVGTGYIPQAVVWYGSRNTTKGKELHQYSIYSLNIEVSKGAEHTIRSGTAKGLIKRLTPEMFKLIGDVKESGFGYIDKHVFDYITLDEHINYAPYMDAAVRLDAYKYFAGAEKVITPRIEDWVKEKSKLVEHNNRLLKRKKFIVDSFKNRCVGIFSPPYRAEHKYFFQEFENGNPVGTRGFFSDLNDLTDLYPHIVAANNMERMAGRKDLFDGGYSDIYKKDHNYLFTRSNINTVNAVSGCAIFPANRIPSEDEANEAERLGGSIGVGGSVQADATETILDILQF